MGAGQTGGAQDFRLPRPLPWLPLQPTLNLPQSCCRLLAASQSAPIAVSGGSGLLNRVRWPCCRSAARCMRYVTAEGTHLETHTHTHNTMMTPGVHIKGIGAGLSGSTLLVISEAAVRAMAGGVALAGHHADPLRGAACPPPAVGSIQAKTGRLCKLSPTTQDLAETRGCSRSHGM